MTNTETQYPLQSQTGKIIGAGIEVHKKLGFGFSEIVYKDALECEFALCGIPFYREKNYVINYKSFVLPHHFHVDFFVFDSVIVEVKAKYEIDSKDISQILNYLKCSGCKVGLILNFGNELMEQKRIIN